jgi:hypothetical protein
MRAHALTRLDLPHAAITLHCALPAAGLRLLLEAYRCGRELEIDDWEFAVEIGCLQAAGLTNTSLRWLLYQGFVLQGADRTEPGAKRRMFQRVTNLSLSNASCFVLTDAGVVFVLKKVLPRPTEVSAPEPEPSPVWDEVRRELRVGAMVVKRFKQPATNQELVLKAFQEENWSHRIDDPLPPEAEQEPKRRLHITITNLNRGQRRPVKVHFAGGGDGQSVCWRLLESECRANAERW